MFIAMLFTSYGSNLSSHQYTLDKKAIVLIYNRILLGYKKPKS